MSSPALKPYVWMLSGCVWFAAMTLFARAASDLTDWPVVAVARSGVATLVAIGMAFAARQALIGTGPKSLWIRSLSGSFSMVCTFYALSRMPASDVLTFTNTFPSWIAILSWPLNNEKPTWGVWSAVAISIVGVTIVGHAQANEANSTFSFMAVVAALAAAFFSAVAMLGLNRLKGIAPLAVVVHFSAVSVLACGMAWLVMRFWPVAEPNVWPPPGPQLIALLVATGATAAIGQLFLTLAYRSGSATKVSVVGLTQVVMVMIAEVALGWKSLNLVAVVGSILVLGPTAYLMIRERKKPPPAADETEMPETVMD
jgi:drug/metabolite transporter (DMT)-like permease